MLKADHDSITNRASTVAAHAVDRRHALRAFAGSVALLASGRIVLAAAPDPVFALIEQHRAAYLAWVAALEIDDGAGPDVEDTGGAEEAAYMAIAEASPETLAGALAAMRYVLGYYEGSHDHLQRVQQEGERAGETFGAYHELFDEETVLTFLTSISDCLAHHIGTEA